MMKKYRYLLLSLVACLLAFAMEAQEPFRREFSLGLGGGASLSNVGFVPRVDQTMLLGMHGGLTMRWITEKNLGLVIELNYAQQGWQEELPLINPDSESSLRYHYARTINYIELPLLTHIYFGGKNVRFILNLGPKFGYAISETTCRRLKGTEPNSGANAQHDMPLENKFDWGICAGPGVEFRTPIGSFLLEGRYYFGLWNMYGNSKADYFSKSNMQTLSVKVSYLFNFKKK